MHTGPQYYGFSDVLVQRAIAGMYTPEELERAQYGLSQVITVDGTQQLLSASERYAAELMTNVRGIGATTATVLATTTSLGGRHTCMADLTLWLAADNKHMEQLQNYLLNRSVLSPTAKITHMGCAMCSILRGVVQKVNPGSHAPACGTCLHAAQHGSRFGAGLYDNDVQCGICDAVQRCPTAAATCLHGETSGFL